MTIPIGTYVKYTGPLLTVVMDRKGVYSVTESRGPFPMVVAMRRDSAGQTGLRKPTEKGTVTLWARDDEIEAET